MSGIKQVAIHEESGWLGAFRDSVESAAACARLAGIKLSRQPDTGDRQILIVVDEDIDPHDLDAVMWAMVFRVHPHRDIQTVTGRRPMMDPSAVSPAHRDGIITTLSRTVHRRCSSTPSKVGLLTGGTAG